MLINAPFYYHCRDKEYLQNGMLEDAHSAGAIYNLIVALACRHWIRDDSIKPLTEVRMQAGHHETISEACQKDITSEGNKETPEGRWQKLLVSFDYLTNITLDLSSPQYTQGKAVQREMVDCLLQYKALRNLELSGIDFSIVEATQELVDEPLRPHLRDFKMSWSSITEPGFCSFLKEHSASLSAL